MRLLFILATFLFFNSGAIAQNYYKDFQDGRLWVKFKYLNNPKTGEPIINSQNIELENLPFINKPDKKYGISKMAKAFRTDAGEKLNSTFVVAFNNIQLVDELIETLSRDPNVEYAERIPLDRFDLSPNDNQFPNQWYLDKISAAGAWDYFSAGSNIVIAIVDDAVERFHADLNPNVWVNPGEIANNGIDDDGNGYIDDINGWDVANNSASVDPPSAASNHGTHVAGISSAATNNGLGLSSIGFSCKIMCVKSTNQPPPSITHGYEGVLYAANNGAHIINMSWGGPNASATAQNVIDFALSKGCILVASAGNSNSSNLSYPAAFNGVISVASTDAGDIKSSFSNFGGWVKISAPGSSILSTLPGSSYGNLSGTSMASPMVAGLLGLMKSLSPTMPNADLINCLYTSADNINALNPTFAGFLGSGRINALKAMECVASTLARAPISNFDANTRNILAEGQVTFVDRSAYAPTSWQWTFPGGTPGTFTGKVPPPIVYNTAGTFEVTLTTSNAFGSNTNTKTSYIVVAPKPTCLSVNLPVPGTWTRTTHTSGSEGYINGTNIYNEKQKGMFFDLSATNNTTLTSVSIGFGIAMASSPNKIITIRILDGSTNLPGAILGSADITYGQIAANVLTNSNTIINFSESIQLPASKKFFVAVDFSSLIHNTESLSIYANRQNQSPTTTIWSMGEDLVWRRYGTPSTWGLTLASLYIHPFVTPNPAKSILNPKNSVVCSGNVVQFDGTGSTFGDLIQWQLPGASAPNTINNQVQVAALYPTAGSFKAYLFTRGGCNEMRVDSTVVTVNARPAIVINATKNPICKGESVTLTASGATTYNWSPATGLNNTTGNTVIANPQQTVSYSITGNLSNCANTVFYELRVAERTAGVSLNASVSSINGPTSVNFTATPSNGGENPSFNFFVNNVSQQSGSGPQFTRTVSPGDQVKCEMTSSEPCVDEKVITSNTVTLESTLPITLFNFTGKETGNGNALSWITSSEINSSHFEIEKGYNGQAFATITTIAAAGNSNANRFYNYLDVKPQKGDNLYRIKMIDKDGSFTYSKVVALNNKNEFSMTTLQNNPTQPNGLARLIIMNGERGDAFITVNNMAGQVLQSYKMSNPNGNIQINLEAKTLSTGTYIITYKNSNGKVLDTIKWIIL